MGRWGAEVTLNEGIVKLAECPSVILKAKALKGNLGLKATGGIGSAGPVEGIPGRVSTRERMAHTG